MINRLIEVEYDEKDKSGEVTEYWDGVKDKSSPTENMKDTWLILPIELTARVVRQD